MIIFFLKIQSSDEMDISLSLYLSISLSLYIYIYIDLSFYLSVYLDIYIYIYIYIYINCWNLKISRKFSACFENDGYFLHFGFDECQSFTERDPLSDYQHSITWTNGFTCVGNIFSEKRKHGLIVDMILSLW